MYFLLERRGVFNKNGERIAEYSLSIKSLARTFTVDRSSQHIPIVVLLTTYFSTMSKEDESPWLTLMKDMKNELIKQMQSSEASIKEQLHTSNE